MSDNFTARELAFAELVRSRLETFHGFFFNGDDGEAEQIAEAVRWASQIPDGAMKVRVHVVVDITDDGKQLIRHSPKTTSSTPPSARENAASAITAARITASSRLTYCPWPSLL